MPMTRKNVIDALLKPESIAVVGASPREGSLGNTVMQKITGFGFTGRIYPINPKAPEILGIKAYPCVSDVPGDIDTAVLCVPGPAVIDVVKDLHRKGVRSCTIISAGFKEIGPEGIEREKELKTLITEFGMRVIGPNCFGIINGSPDCSLDCTFARNFAPKGHIGFVSQSGAVGAGINEDLRRTTMGLSMFISLGNRIDFNENEALEYLARDENTRIIFMYLENFADPVRFLEVAGSITPRKPIIALKAGRSTQGAKAAASHTGQLAQSERMVEALLEKAGIIRVYSVPELIQAAKALYAGILPEKEDLAVITNAGGFGVLAIDKAEELNLKLAEFAPETTKYLEEHLPVEASCANPIDVLGTGTDEHYGTALEAVMRDPNVGGVVYNFGPPVMQKAVPIAQSAVDMARKYHNKPILTIYMNRHRIMEPYKEAPDVYLPQFDYPEEAVWAYSKLLQYRRIKERGTSEPLPAFKGDSETVKRILDTVRREGRDRLDFDEGEAVLEAYGIPVAKSVKVVMGDSIEEKTKGMRYPVAIKPAWGGVTHKTEFKAVRLNLKTPAEVLEAVQDVCGAIASRLGKEYDGGFIVQEMTPGVQETILGAVKQDAGFHLLMFGLGGIFVELLKDVAFSIPPLSAEETSRMVREIKAYPLLAGFRGSEPAAVGDIESALRRLGQLVLDFPELKELDINPFIVSSEPGASRAVDVRIII